MLKRALDCQGPTSTAEAAVPRHSRAMILACVAAFMVAVGGSPMVPPTPAAAQAVEKPYDDRLLRLAEILGAVHYLRELCGANEGQTWRDRMREILDSEGSNALRRARLTRSFNQGYQSYSKTHKVCTTTARTAISRFMSEGVQIAEVLIKSVP